jgi:hypothetical protein
MRIPRLGTLVVLLIILFLLCASLTVTAQHNQLLTKLEGTWHGEGKSRGMPNRLQLKWEWVLDKKFLRLSLRNEMSVRDGAKLVFEGHAYYGPAGDRYEAQWFDSRGWNFPIKAQVEGDSLISDWGSPDKEEGKSTYRLIDETTLEVVDSVKQKDGSLREFGRATLKRVN